ncbi:MAG: hypothetical protein BroJett018_37850 [Chloroflexota bacterium]|nr:hypothetical protein [Chloroflexota bacterium]NOG64444.1 hypothetical protein [Chloroflexota bacterium]GIK65991.1 MAG: hypothetical protein BroJett018_37850 [Chloroflexota bacterium]
MQGDSSFNDFLTQGPIIRLAVTTCFFGLLWLSAVFLVNRRSAERRRRKREGLPPLPNAFTQLTSTLRRVSQNSAIRMQPQTANASTGYVSKVPLPDLNMLTSDLPEPDFDNFVAMVDQIQQAPPAVTPKPTSSFAASDTHEGEFEEIKMTNQSSGNEFVGNDPRRSTSTIYIAGSNEIPADAVEVMRVWRDVSDGSLIIQMNGKVFQTVGEMQDRGLAKRFISLVRDLAQMARVGAQAVGLPVPNFDSSASVVSEQGAWAAPKTPINVPASTSPRTGQDYSTMEPPLIVTGLDQAPPANNTIAGQIEELLQYRLMQNSMFQHRSIHVRANPDNTIRIEADGRTYQHVDEVVDVDVREFIQSVIREWEARQ